MGINIYINEIITQKDSATKQARRYQRYAGEVEQVMNDFFENQELAGEGYDSQRKYFNGVYTPLIKGLYMVSIALMDAHYLFVENYQEQFGNVDTIEDDLRNRIEVWKNKTEEVRNTLENTEGLMKVTTEIYLSTLTKVESTLQERLEKLNTFNETSPSLFSEVEELLSQVEAGLNVLKQKGESQSYDLSKMDLSWVDSLNKAWEKNKDRKTLSDQKLEQEGKDIIAELGERKYIQIDMYGKKMWVWTYNSMQITGEEFALTEKYEDWKRRYNQRYGINKPSPDYMGILAFEAREGVEYGTGRPLTKTEILQRRFALLSFGVNIAISGYYASKVPDPSMDNLVNQTGLTAEQLDDIMKYMGMNKEQLTVALKNGSLESLLGIPEMNMTYLVQQTGKTPSEILSYLENQGMSIENVTGANVGGIIDGLQKPWQVHHFASDKNSTYTDKFKEITDRYGLDLNGDWNKQSLPHQGRHPNAYHEWVLERMEAIDKLAQGNTELFLELFEQNIKNPVINNPNMLYSEYWKNLNK